MKEINSPIPITPEELAEATEAFLSRLRTGSTDPNPIISSALKRLLVLYSDPAQLEKEVSAQLRINPWQLLGRPLGTESASDKRESTPGPIFPEPDQSEIIGTDELQISAELDEEEDGFWVRYLYYKTVGEEM